MYGAAENLPDTIELTAVDAARNIRRRYAIVISTDLFGAIIVETHWGRVGARGQAKALSFEDRAMADGYIASTLHRRSTSSTRIGVAYERLEGVMYFLA
ncbi:WGR domain-containing protein [Kozakia baliensis]|uniref:WGR domain-containing protein n=1 Tax=Kozakia baliensis TaxID=153496 RepID=UPI000497064B|nr:WGR domain-containing protein [Kozakia baliensis]